MIMMLLLIMMKIMMMMVTPERCGAYVARLSACHHPALASIFPSLLQATAFVTFILEEVYDRGNDVPFIWHHRRDFLPLPPGVVTLGHIWSVLDADDEWTR